MGAAMGALGRAAEIAARGSFPRCRPQRLRSTAALRRLVADVRVSPADLVLPLFHREGASHPVAIESMPGVFQHTRDSLRAAAAEAVEVGLGGLMLFAIPRERDAVGSGAVDPEGVLGQAVSLVRAEVGDNLVVMADLCLDEFTSHGHCGVLDGTGRIDNDATLDRYRQMARALADAGAGVVGTSGMMDGQVGAVRDALDDYGRSDVAILAYSGKTTSALYGPFREAVDSALTGGRLTYQQDPAASRDALRDVAFDLAEGADIVMVKPASWCLDVLRQVSEVSPVPVAAYQVSGEYSMIHAAAARGWIDLDAAFEESLVAIRRAGASIILTYRAVEFARTGR